MAITISRRKIPKSLSGIETGGYAEDGREHNAAKYLFPHLGLETQVRSRVCKARQGAKYLKPYQGFKANALAESESHIETYKIAFAKLVHLTAIYSASYYVRSIDRN